MNQSFTRKIVYLVILVLLLFPMAWLGSPSTRTDAGGKLAQLRSEAKLGQEDLGAIDPASETIRMATLGLRGMAVTMLWNKANEYKKVGDWTAFRATLEQLARLQPYFVKVWQYQAWNLTYNVSVELDDFRDRFYYVKQGINYLKNGIEYLRDNPTLLDDLGWFTGNKVGRADEHVFYRRLFKLDEELHSPDTPTIERDNWLVSRKWYELAISAIDDKKMPIGAKNPVTFFDSPARSQMSYAEAIEDEGVLQSRWRTAWEEGDRLWRAYANRDLRSTDGFLYRLADMEKYEADIKEYRAELDELSPGLEQQMQEEARALLTPEQRQVLDSPPIEPTAEQMDLQTAANDAMHITPSEVASRIAKDKPELAIEARRLASQINDAQERINTIDINRDVANFKYWGARCEIEQSTEALDARELAHEAKSAFNKADLESARELYERSFDAWAQAFEKHPSMAPDSTFGDDLMEFVDDYNAVLEQLDLSLADPEVAERFPLWAVVEANDGERKYEEALNKRLGRETQEVGEPAINPADMLGK
jgi:hypothetical protein